MAPRRPATNTSIDYSATLPLRQPLSVIGDTVRRMRIAIMTGRFAPGQKLVEADLCKDFAVSRASLRETLRLLQAEQLIEIAPHRGSSVVKLDRKDVEDIHEIWSLLTGEAVYRFASKAGPADVAALNAAVDRLRAAVARNDVLGQLAAVNSFFGHILDRCDNQALIGTVSTLVSRVNFLRAQALHQQSLGALAIDELGDIAAAIADGNSDAARQAARRHITSACTAAKQATLAPMRNVGPFRKTDADSLASAGLMA
jgi:DNA-binding GntR family transcriptional regulator